MEQMLIGMLERLAEKLIGPRMPEYILMFHQAISDLNSFKQDIASIKADQQRILMVIDPPSFGEQIFLANNGDQPSQHGLEALIAQAEYDRNNGRGSDSNGTVIHFDASGGRASSVSG